MLNNPASVQSIPGLVLLGIAVLVSLRLFYFGRTEAPEDALHLSLSATGRVMIAVGLLETCVLFFNVLVVLLLLTALAVAADEYWKHRASRQASLLAVLAAAVGKSMPLSPALEAFSAEWGGGFGLRTRHLARLVADGAPLSLALRQSGGLASPKALALIEAGEATGSLAAVIGVAARLYLPRSIIDKIAAIYWYLFYTVAIMVGVLSFCMIKIVPAMIKIFDDFDADLPGITLLLIRTSEIAIVLIPLGAVLGIGIFIYAAMRHFGLTGWDPPIAAGLVRRWNMATVLRTGAIAAEARRPLEAVFGALARAYPNNSLRRRLTEALSDVSLGADWCDSFQARGLLRETEAGLLKAAARAGNLPWAMRETAEAIERRFSYRIWAVSQWLGPVMVATLGGLTCLIVVGLFAPLVTLIERLL